MSRKQSGFTLIELMIVVAIIGILAAIAMPAYSDYTQRTKVAGALSAINTFKVAVNVCYTDRGLFNGCNQNTNDIPNGIATGDNGATINYIDGLSVTNGVIILTTTGLDKASNKMVITLTPTLTNQNTNILWKLTGTGCRTTTPGRGIDCSGN